MKSLWVCQGNWHRQKSPELKASRCLSALLKLPINNNETNTQQRQQKTPMQQPTLLWTSNSPIQCIRGLMFQTTVEIQIPSCSWVGIGGKLLQKLCYHKWSAKAVWDLDNLLWILLPLLLSYELDDKIKYSDFWQRGQKRKTSFQHHRLTVALEKQK